MNYQITSYEGKNGVWYASTEIGEQPYVWTIRGRGGSREDAIAEVERQLAADLASRQKKEESILTHSVEIIPEGAGVRVLETQETEEEGDDDI